MRVRPTLFVFAFALAAAPPASGADLFTINVPVEFKNLNAAVTRVNVKCTLTGKDPITLTQKIVGEETKPLPVSGGNYTGPSPVTFVFSATTKAEVGTFSIVTGGSCEFTLRTPDGDTAPTAGDTRPVFAQQPGAPFQQKVTFTFP